MTNFDVVRLAAEQATKRFDSSDSVFNAAGFGKSLMQIAGLKGVIDGHLVRAILCGRNDIEILKGGAHFRIK